MNIVQRIFKYPLVVMDVQVVHMPAGAVILSVDVQRDVPCLWALVNPDAVTSLRRIRMYGTGHPVDDPPGYFIGTIQLEGGALVFHVFDERR